MKRMIRSPAQIYFHTLTPVGWSEIKSARRAVSRKKGEVLLQRCFSLARGGEWWMGGEERMNTKAGGKRVHGKKDLRTMEGRQASPNTSKLDLGTPLISTLTMSSVSVSSHVCDGVMKPMVSRFACAEESGGPSRWKGNLAFIVRMYLRRKK